MTKCPYVPPHEWNLDFPHTMLRAKAIKFRKGEVKAGEKFLASTDTHGSFAGIPIVVQVANAANHTKPGAAVIEKVLNVDRTAWLPDLATKKFRSGAAPNRRPHAGEGRRQDAGKVADVRHLLRQLQRARHRPRPAEDPGPQRRALRAGRQGKVLRHAQAGAGRPGRRRREQAGEHPGAGAYAREGYAILSAVPSCTLMFKQELPLMYPHDADVQLVKEAMWDPFEYLTQRRRDGLLKTDFSKPLGKVSYHTPCHGRVQNIGKRTEELLKLIPGTQVATHERCSGHAGTFGVKKGYHEVAMKIGKPLFKKHGRAPRRRRARHHQLRLPAGRPPHRAGIRAQRAGLAALKHPLSLVREAYGLT
jgi:glycerol-3-phosphate dehydrogenase subunit C